MYLVTSSPCNAGAMDVAVRASFNSFASAKAMFDVLVGAAHAEGVNYNVTLQGHASDSSGGSIGFEVVLEYNGMLRHTNTEINV